MPVQAGPGTTTAAQAHPEDDAYNHSHAPLLFQMEDIHRLPPVVLMASRGDLTVPRWACSPVQHLRSRQSIANSKLLACCSVQTQDMAGTMEACGVQTASHIFDSLTHVDFVSAWLGHDKEGFQQQLLQHLLQ